MTSTLDHVADSNGVELHRLFQLYDIPGFVKKASRSESFPAKPLAHSVYADEMDRQFPCHNAASTYLSALFFQEKRAELHPTPAARIEQRLDKNVEYWGIKGAVDEMRARHNEMTKNSDDQLHDDDFAFVWKDDVGKHRSLRIKNAMETKVAAEWLFTYRDRLPFSDRNVIATKILEKAARYGAGLGDHEDFIHKQAGWGICKPEEVVTMLINRAKLAKQANHREGILKLAETVRTSPSTVLRPDQLIKLATTVDIVDRALNLVGRYTDTIPRPEDVIFKLSYKEAQATVNDLCALTSGTTYSKNDLAHIKLGDVQGLFGAEFANDVSTGLNKVDPEKMAEMVATMPRDDAELFDKLAKEAGITPITIKAASTPQRRPAAAVAAAAAGYR